MLTVTSKIIDQPQLGATVGLCVEQGRPAVVEVEQRSRYTLAELLAASDYSRLQSAEAREWIDTPAVGREPL